MTAPLCCTRRLLAVFPLVIISLVSFSVGATCCQLLTLADYEAKAEANLPKALKDYLQRGAGNDETLKSNQADFRKLKILPRYLRDVSNRSTTAKILGRNFNMPIGIAPSGLHKRWHPEGELATVRAAATSGTIMILSSASSTFIEDVAREGPNVEKWIQTFIYKNISITLDLIERAYKSGFKAVVVTVDSPLKALRYENKRNVYKDNFKYVNMERYSEDTEGRKMVPGVTWDHIDTVVKKINIPVFLKGVLSGEDAVLAKGHGVRGIIVSTHGGRELDGAISSVAALNLMLTNYPFLHKHPEFDIYMDGGIRSGLDVFRALALGAKFVFVGRPPMWGLHHSGQQGVENVLQILQNEFETVMAQAGCCSLECIRPELLDGRSLLLESCT